MEMTFEVALAEAKKFGNFFKAFSKIEEVVEAAVLVEQNTKELSRQRETLSSEIEPLRREKTRLEGEISLLRQERDRLEPLVESLQAKLSELKAKFG
jgi:predicted nuclease with TOPRIM domain